MKKFLKAKNLIILAFVAAAAVYAVVASFFSLRFFPGTVIGGEDVSLMTLYEADKLVGEASRIASIDISMRNGEETMDLGEARVRRTYPEPADILAAQAYYAWPLYLSGRRVYGESYEVVWDEEGLQSAISLFLAGQADDSVRAEAAYVDFDEALGAYTVVPDSEGTVIDRTRFKRALTDKLKQDSEVVDLVSSDAYYHAFTRADDPALLEEADFLNAINLRSISIDMGAGVTETISGRAILDFLDEERAPDEEKIAQYMESLAADYDTYDTSVKRTFVTHSQETRRLTAYYGWQLNQKKSAAALSGALAGIISEASADRVPDEESRDIELAAVWTHTAASHSGPDYGDTYIEVDMGEQYVYVYSQGEIVIDTPCVTGLYNDEKRRTPAGIWSIKSKQTNKTLTGYLPDGSIDYQSFVNYWMPFNGGIGLHDATWRGTFGGNIYMTNGSHGCINLPKSAAKELYSLCYVGMPVICHY